MENLINQINELQSEYNHLYSQVAREADLTVRAMLKDRMREITILLTELNEELSETVSNN